MSPVFDCKLNYLSTLSKKLRVNQEQKYLMVLLLLFDHVFIHTVIPETVIKDYPQPVYDYELKRGKIWSVGWFYGMDKKVKDWIEVDYFTIALSLKFPLNCNK